VVFAVRFQKKRTAKNFLPFAVRPKRTAKTGFPVV
jgi:hypothetical protein